MKDWADTLREVLVTDLQVYYMGDAPQNPNALDYACVVGYEEDGTNVPTKLVTFIGTGGPNPRHSLTRSIKPTRYPSAVVLVRAGDYDSARDKAESLRAHLGEKTRFIQNSTVYGGVWVTEVLALGKDEQSRFEFQFNARTTCKDQ